MAGLAHRVRATERFRGARNGNSLASAPGASDTQGSAVDAVTRGLLGESPELMRRTSDDPTLAGSLRPRGPVQLTVTTRHEAGATILTVTGELDVLTAPRLSVPLDDVIRRDGDDVVIDLSGAGFIDSLGLRTLLSAQRRLARRSRSLTVVCGKGPVRRAIELARLAGALGLVWSLDDYRLRRSSRSG